MSCYENMSKHRIRLAMLANRKYGTDPTIDRSLDILFGHCCPHRQRRSSSILVRIKISLLDMVKSEAEGPTGVYAGRIDDIMYDYDIVCDHDSLHSRLTRAGMQCGRSGTRKAEISRVVRAVTTHPRS